MGRAVCASRWTGWGLPPATGAIAFTLYAWDYRNRLISVTNENNAGQVTQTVTYTYDAFDGLVAEPSRSPASLTRRPPLFTTASKSWSNSMAPARSTVYAVLGRA